MKSWQKGLIAVLLFALLAVLISRGCGGTNQYAQLGEQLGQRATGNSQVASYAYVADSRRALYWPNEPKYVEAIPAADRVWIADKETLKQFRSYRPGPR